MKRAFVTTVCLLAVGFAASAADPTGTWNMKMDFQGNEVPATMIVKKQDDGTYAGTWGGRRGEDTLMNVKVEGDTITFDRKIEVQGQEFELAFTGKVEGDSITGAFDTAMGSMAVTGARDAAATPAAADAEKPGLVGTWDVVSESQLGTLNRTLIVKDDMTGVYKTDTAEFPLSNLKVDGDTVTFNVTLDLQGQELPMAFTGKIDGMNLTGELASEAGNATITGKKQAAVADTPEIAEVRKATDEILAALKGQDVDALMAFYADDFASADGMDKAAFTEFLVGAKEQAMLEGLEASTEAVTITREGDTAKVEGVELEGAFGVLTINFELAKRDGKWLVTKQEQY